jgi:hypothetical protein
MRDNYIEHLLKTAKTIAVVGLSPKVARASYEVAEYMQSNGYRILAINPSRAGSVILGEHCYANLAEAVAATGLKIDIVDCFRKSEDIPPIVDEAIAAGVSCVWMQLDIMNEAAAEVAERAGIHVIMDKCLKIEHATRAASKH